MDNIEPKYTSYSPWSGYSLDDLTKILYSDRDIQEKNIEALGNIVKNTERMTNLPIQYLNSLEFLEGDNVNKVDELKERINNIVNSEWDNKKTPSELSSIIRDIGSELGPNGNIGKAIKRNELHQSWLLDKSNNEAFKTLDKDTIEKLINENKNILLGINNTSEMVDVAASSKVAALPDFNTILSNDAMKSIIGSSAFQTKHYGYLYSLETGLPKEIAADVINGIVKQDNSIITWFEQYKRLNNATCTLDNCIDSEGNVKEDLPEELKAALQDAYGRATATSTKIIPYSVGNGSGKGNGNGNGYEKNDDNGVLETKKMTVHLPSPINMLSLSQMSKTGGNEHYIQYFKDKMKSNTYWDNNKIKIPDISNNFIYEQNWDEILGISPENNLYDINNIEFEKLLNNNKITFEYKDSSKSTYFYRTINNSKKVIAEINGNVNNKTLATYLKGMYMTLNERFKENTSALNDYKFFIYNTPIEKHNLDKNDFSMIMKDSNEQYAVDNDKMEGVKKIKNIIGINYGTSLGPISFLATIVNDKDEEIQVILKPKKDYSAMAKFAYNRLSQKEKQTNAGLSFILNNIEYANLCYAIENQWIKKDNNGNLYKELEINDKLCRSLGLDYIPVAFYGTRIRMTQEGMGQNKITTYYFVDSKGRQIGNYVERNISALLNDIIAYGAVYENVNRLSGDANLKNYCLKRCTGIKDFDVDNFEDDVQVLFPEYNENYNSSKPKITTELKSIVLMLESNGKKLNSADYIADTRSKNGEKYLIDLNIKQGDPVCAGDLVKLDGENEFYIIIPYRNEFIFVDKDFNYKGDCTKSKISNTRNSFYKGKYRGKIIE